MNIRKNDMSQWFGSTRRCSDLEQAIAFAMTDLQRTSHISIWPLYEGWLVITFMSALVN